MVDKKLNKKEDYQQPQVEILQIFYEDVIRTSEPEPCLDCPHLF